MILTTSRVVCLNKSSSQFKAFDLPLGLITNEDFKQPIFGANYICGTCKPLMDYLPGMISFKIWFMNGGCGVFVPNFLKMVKTMRRNQNRGIDTQTIKALQKGHFMSAYTDPNDPSVIYLQQPQIVQCGNYNPNSYMPIQPSYQPIQQPQANYQPVNPMPLQPQYQPQPMQQQYQPQPMQQQYQPQPMQQQYQPQPMQQQYQPQPMEQQYQPQPMQQQYQPQPMQQQYQPQPMQQQFQPQQFQPQPMAPQQNQPHPMEPQPQPMDQQYYPQYEVNNEYPSIEELNQQSTSEQPNAQYPQQGNINVLNNLQQENQGNNNPKYFGFFGPELKKNY